MTTKLEGGRGKPLVTGPLKKITFFCGFPIMVRGESLVWKGLSDEKIIVIFLLLYIYIYIIFYVIFLFVSIESYRDIILPKKNRFAVGALCQKQYRTVLRLS